MTSPVVSREQAGLPAPRSISTSITGEGVTFHYGGDALGGYPWEHSRCPSIWRAWCDYHRSRGWADIAYSYGACIHGFVFVGRGRGARTAAQGTNDGNNRSYAVCYMAGVGEPLTDVGKRAMLDARAMTGAGRTLWPHDFWHSTGCPGSPIRDWVKAGAPAPDVAWTPPPQPKISTRAAAFAATPSGRGYIIVGVDGGVFCYGDAMFFGSLPGLGVTPNEPIVSADVTPSGGGYLLVDAAGGVYAFGDARFAGSLAGVALSAPIEEARITPTGAGYWLLGSDGGVFAFGDAPYEGAAT